MIPGPDVTAGNGQRPVRVWFLSHGSKNGGNAPPQKSITARASYALTVIVISPLKTAFHSSFLSDSCARDPVNQAFCRVFNVLPIQFFPFPGAAFQFVHDVLILLPNKE